MLSKRIKIVTGVLALLILFMGSCSEDDEHTSTQVLEDNLEGSNGWEFVNVAPADHEGNLDNSVSSSSSHSLSITSSSSQTGGFSFWRYAISQPDIPVGASLELTAKVKVSALTGDGAFMAIRGDKNSTSAFFKTTQGLQVIGGTKDFTSYHVKLDPYPEGVDVIYIFLILDSTSMGSVYFDDISLVSHH